MQYYEIANEKYERVSHYIRKELLVLLQAPPDDDEALKFGREMHENIETAIHDREKIANTLPSFQKFLMDSRDLIKPFPYSMTEVTVFDREKRIAGTFDYYSLRDRILIDWKTTWKSKKTLLEYYKAFIDAFNDGKYEPLNHYLFGYVLQQVLYASLMEKTFGFQPEKMLLVFLNKGNDEYTIVSVNAILKKLNTDDVVEDVKRMKDEWKSKSTLSRYLNV